MQALIDFEGWRKWRGFAAPLPAITIPGVASPMQGGDGDPNKPEPSSPPGFGEAVAAKSKGVPDGANGDLRPPRPTDAIAREDSSGSGGSGVSADTLDSPTNLISTTTTS